MSEEALQKTESIPATSVELQPVAPKTYPVSDRIRAANFRRMINLVNRVRLLPGGERLFVRFSQAEIFEHWVILGAFTVLAITGLLEMFAQSRIPADLIALISRNIDNVHNLHNVAALVFTVIALVHVIRMLAKWYVKGDPVSLMPSDA